MSVNLSRLTAIRHALPLWAWHFYYIIILSCQLLELLFDNSNCEGVIMFKVHIYSLRMLLLHLQALQLRLCTSILDSGLVPNLHLPTFPVLRPTTNLALTSDQIGRWWRTIFWPAPASEHHLFFKQKTDYIFLNLYY